MTIEKERVFYRFQLVAIAGTFDLLHRGHKYFISQTFKMGRRVIIGLTSDEYVEEKSKVKRLRRAQPRRQKSKVAPSGVVKDAKAPQGWMNVFPRSEGIGIKSYEERKEELTTFLKQNNLLSRAQIVPINDIYGPAIFDNEIEALVVTSETENGARKVNKKRREKRLAPLPIAKLSLVLASDRRRISSSRIRLGEINRWGRLYSNISLLGSISQQLRLELKKPQGKLIKGDPERHSKLWRDLERELISIDPIMIITVGDETTRLINKTDMISDISIIDFKVARVKKYDRISELGFPKRKKRLDKGVKIVRVLNPAGGITRTLVKRIRQTINKYIIYGKQQIIKVTGEEDLAGLPAILQAPLGSVVLYGQPGEGVVVVDVTEKKKRELIDLIKQSSK